MEKSQQHRRYGWNLMAKFVFWHEFVHNWRFFAVTYQKHIVVHLKLRNKCHRYWRLDWNVTEQSICSCQRAQRGQNVASMFSQFLATAKNNNNIYIRHIKLTHLKQLGLLWLFLRSRRDRDRCTIRRQTVERPKSAGRADRVRSCLPQIAALNCSPPARRNKSLEIKICCRSCNSS